jgi:hypothetical protein
MGDLNDAHELRRRWMRSHKANGLSLQPNETDRALVAREVQVSRWYQELSAAGNQRHHTTEHSRPSTRGALAPSETLPPDSGCFIRRESTAARRRRHRSTRPPQAEKPDKARILYDATTTKHAYSMQTKFDGTWYETRGRHHSGKGWLQKRALRQRGLHSTGIRQKKRYMAVSLSSDPVQRYADSMVLYSRPNINAWSTKEREKEDSGACAMKPSSAKRHTRYTQGGHLMLKLWL